MRLSNRRLPRTTVAFLVLVGTGGAAAPQQPEPVDVQAEQQEAAGSIGREVGRLKFQSSDDDAPLIPSSASVLRWSNPDVGRVYGDVYVWTSDGRPSAAVSIYQWFHPFQSVDLEFVSLSDSPLRGWYDGDLAWNVEIEGVTWRSLEIQAPAKSRALRLIEMKRAAGDFAAELFDERTDAEGVTRRLRPLSTPIYRYPEEALSDGALFSFVVGTDPELLLLIETYDDSWRYALARMNRDALIVTFNEIEVQRYEHIPNGLFESNQPYFLMNARQPVADQKPSSSIQSE